MNRDFQRFNSSKISNLQNISFKNVQRQNVFQAILSIPFSFWAPPTHNEMMTHLALYIFRPSSSSLPTAYVVRREGNVFTCVCPSIHPSNCLSTLGGGVPQPGPGWGWYPSQGGTQWGVPHLRYPPLDLAGGVGWGVPLPPPRRTWP